LKLHALRPANRIFKDANDIMNHNMRHIQVMITDVANGILESRNQYRKNRTELIDRLRSSAEISAADKAKMIIDLDEGFQDKERESLKTVNMLVKTSRDIANEVRQSAMARRLNIHVNDVRIMLISFKRVLHRRVTDVNVLAQISEDFDEVCKKLFPIKAEGDY
jgi:hypothetical protein